MKKIPAKGESLNDSKDEKDRATPYMSLTQNKAQAAECSEITRLSSRVEC
jgi:hypothetical protein